MGITYLKVKLANLLNLKKNLGHRFLINSGVISSVVSTLENLMIFINPFSRVLEPLPMLLM